MRKVRYLWKYFLKKDFMKHCYSLIRALGVIFFVKGSWFFFSWEPYLMCFLSPSSFWSPPLFWDTGFIILANWTWLIKPKSRCSELTIAWSGKWPKNLVGKKQNIDDCIFKLNIQESLNISHEVLLSIKLDTNSSKRNYMLDSRDISWRNSHTYYLLAWHVSESFNSHYYQNVEWEVGLRQHW